MTTSKIFCKGCGEQFVRDPASPDDTIEVERIRRVRPEPGDMVVITIAGEVDPDQLQALADDLAGFWPNNRVLLLAEGSDVQVLGPAVAESKAREHEALSTPPAH